VRAVVQRVTSASVDVDGERVGEIGAGLLVLLGVAQADLSEAATWMARKIVSLRIFEDAAGRMDRSLDEVGGALLAVSQFTLLGDVRKGRRPSFVGAAPPAHAEVLYREFVDAVSSLGIETATGTFQTHMKVSLVNDGPVTIVVESP